MNKVPPQLSTDTDTDDPKTALWEHAKKLPGQQQLVLLSCALGVLLAGMGGGYWVTHYQIDKLEFEKSRLESKIDQQSTSKSNFPSGSLRLVEMHYESRPVSEKYVTISGDESTSEVREIGAIETALYNFRVENIGSESLTLNKVILVPETVIWSYYTDEGTTKYIPLDLKKTRTTFCLLNPQPTVETMKELQVQVSPGQTVDVPVLFNLAKPTPGRILHVIGFIEFIAGQNSFISDTIHIELHPDGISIPCKDTPAKSDSEA